MTRRRRYGAAVADPSGPINSQLLPFELLLDEPFYQLVRQRLLAHALEQAGAEEASRVRLVHVLPPGNDAYQRSLARAEQRALGTSVSEIWQRLLRRPDRFLSVDSVIFLDPSITSGEYVARYGTSAQPCDQFRCLPSTRTRPHPGFVSRIPPTSTPARDRTAIRTTGPGAGWR